MSVMSDALSILLLLVEIHIYQIASQAARGRRWRSGSVPPVWLWWVPTRLRLRASVKAALRRDAQPRLSV